MLTSATWSNFKLFRDPTPLSFGRITVLCGANGRGKSSALQPILCLAQSQVHELADPVRLSGELVDLGNFDEVRNRDTPSGEPIRWDFEFCPRRNADDLWVVSLALEGTVEEPTFLTLSGVEVDPGGRWRIHPTTKLLQEWSGFEWRSPSPGTQDPLWTPVPIDDDGTSDELRDKLRFPDLRYVCADRLGPQSFAPREVLNRRLSVGSRGQHTIEVLGRVQDNQTPVDAARAAPQPQTEALTVFDQANAWMRYIFDGAAIEVRSNDLVRMLRMNADNGAHYARPSNIGYGFTCLLPIIVEGLLAKQGSILIIENPEAHLNPAAVSRFARFLTSIAGDGVQVFVETHSEHMVNGLRLDVKSGLLQPEDLSMLFFQRSSDAPVLKVEVDASGRIAHWPDGFFDTSTNDLARIHGF